MPDSRSTYRPESAGQFGRVLRQLLKERKLSQREFAKRTGLDGGYLSKLVNGKIGEPGREFVLSIAQALDLSVEALWVAVEAGDVGESIAVESADKGVDSTVELDVSKRLVGAEQIRDVPLWMGRDALLEELRDELLVTKRKMLVLVGQGGIGKTSLAVKLLEACGVVPESWVRSPNCVYEQVLYCRVGRASGFYTIAANFFEALGRDGTDLVPSAKIDAIMAELAKNRWLIVLDNLESVLDAETGRSQDSDLGELLNRLAYSGHRSQIIITSRELPWDLADRRGRRIDRKLVRVEKIMGISLDASIELLRDYAPDVAEEDLRWVADAVKGQVLVLTQLGNLLADTSIAYLWNHPELVTEDVDPILREQIDRLDDGARELLKRMSVLRVSMGEVGLAFLRLCQSGESGIQRPDEELVKSNLKETRSLLKRLVNCSLIQEMHDIQVGEISYSLHPVIAEFLRQEYEKEVNLLFKYAAIFYGSIAYEEEFTCFEQLESIIEEMYCWWNMGMEEKVAKIAIESFPGMLKPWGKWGILREWMERVLPYSEGGLKRDCLRAIGGVYRDIGDWDKAEVYFREALMLAEQEDSKAGRAVSWSLLGNIESKRGNWDKAERLYRQCLEIKEELGDRSGMATSWGVLGDIESNRGNWDEAERLYRQYQKMCEELGDRSGMASCWGVLGDIERMRGNYEAAEQLKIQSFNLRQELGDRHGMCMSLRTQAGIANEQNLWDKAEKLISQSLKIATELNSADEIAIILGVRGSTNRRQGNLDAAEILFQDSLAQSQHLGMTDNIAEINWELAQLYRAKNNPDRAQQHYAIAHQLYTQLGAAKDLEKIEQEWNAM
jgi:tetratricopeptide (TPR) repeat protein/transcriptional regulator with XRE-family HTH domain